MAEQRFTFNFSEGEVTALIDFFETNLFEAIRNDMEIDNINWLCDMTSIYKKLKEAGIEDG